MYWKLLIPALFLLIAGVTAAARGDQSATVSTGSVTASPQLEFRGIVDLEEPNGLVLVKPRVALDPLGGYLVADARERQIRRYNADGSLDRVIARRGNGPGEVRQPVSVIRLPSREIVGVDLRGRIAFYDERGDEVIRTQTVPLFPIFSAAFLDDSTLVLAARSEDPDDNHLLHLWDMKRERLVRSFGNVPAHRKELEGAYALNGSASVAVRGGKIALLYALADTVWLFDRHGEPIRSIPVEWPRYRQLKTPLPEGEGAEEMDRWLSTFTLGSSVHWYDDRSLIVQFLDAHGEDRVWSIVGVSETGKPLFEFHDKPRLLTVSPTDGQLLFVNPDSDYENSWIRGFVR